MVRVPKKRVRISPTPLEAVSHFALQILFNSDLSLDDCDVVVEVIRGVKTNLYSFRTDDTVEDLMTRLRDLIESFDGRRGRMKIAYTTLARLTGAEQLEIILTALIQALNSRGFRKATVKERRQSKAALSDTNREVLAKTQYSQFRPLRNKGTVREHRPRDHNEFDQPRSARKPKKFRPLELPPEQQRLQEPEQGAATPRPTLDSFKETDIIVPSDLSAWQLRLLIKTLS